MATGGISPYLTVLFCGLTKPKGKVRLFTAERHAERAGLSRQGLSTEDYGAVGRAETAAPPRKGASKLISDAAELIHLPQTGPMIVMMADDLS